MRLLSPILVALVVFVPVFSGCDDDDPQEDLRYTITVDNDTAQAYDIWVDDDTSTEPFVLRGTVDAMTIFILTNRTVGTTYHIRLTLPGNEPDTTFAYERTFESSAPDDVVWTLEP